MIVFSLEMHWTLNDKKKDQTFWLIKVSTKNVWKDECNKSMLSNFLQYVKLQKKCGILVDRLYMNRVEKCMICWVLNAWNTILTAHFRPWRTSQTSSITNYYCELVDLMISVICYKGCEGLFFGFKLVSLNKYLITVLNNTKTVDC